MWYHFIIPPVFFLSAHDRAPRLCVSWGMLINIIKSLFSYIGQYIKCSQNLSHGWLILLAFPSVLFSAPPPFEKLPTSSRWHFRQIVKLSARLIDTRCLLDLQNAGSYWDTHILSHFRLCITSAETNFTAQAMRFLWHLVSLQRWNADLYTT